MYPERVPCVPSLGSLDPSMPEQWRLLFKVRVLPARQAKFNKSLSPKRSSFSPTCSPRTHPAILKFLWLWIFRIWFGL